VFGLRKKISAPSEVSGVRIRPSVRARRMALRVDVKSGEVVLTWPRGTSETKARRFIEENRRWIDQHRKKIQLPPVFVHGGKISVHGRMAEIMHKAGRGVTRFEGNHLVVHGREEHISRRIRDFLKERAREALTQAVEAKMTDIGKKIAAIRVIDPKTRWGSCSPDGSVMFSWRLILTPPEVLDYVVAHEVAHCIHMNHSRKFWALCIWKLALQFWFNRLRHGRCLDILVTHSPPRGIHDRSDPAHIGFRVFRKFMRRYRPAYLLHGHAHVYRNNAVTHTVFQQTQVINVYPYRLIEI